MTDTAPTDPRAPDVDLGHPVRSFVLVLITIGLLLVATQASGIVQPRVTSYQGQTATGSYGDRMWFAVVLRNDGLVRVRIESVSWPTTGTTDPAVDVLPQGTAIPGPLPAAAPGDTAAPFTLDPGERRVVVTSGRPTCPSSFGAADLRLRARSLLRVTRTVVVQVGGLIGQGCP